MFHAGLNSEKIATHSKMEVRTMKREIEHAIALSGEYCLTACKLVLSVCLFVCVCLHILGVCLYINVVSGSMCASKDNILYGT